jgi:hypothetical protein
MAAYSAIAGRVGYAGAIRGLRRAGVQTGISLTAGHGEGSAVMNMHPMGDPSGTLTDPQDHTTITALRQITAEQLRPSARTRWCI